MRANEVRTKRELRQYISGRKEILKDIRRQIVEVDRLIAIEDAKMLEIRRQLGLKLTPVRLKEARKENLEETQSKRASDRVRKQKDRARKRGEARAKERSA